MLLLGSSVVYDDLSSNQKRCELLRKVGIQEWVDSGDTGSLGLSPGNKVEHHRLHHWKFTRATKLATPMGVEDSSIYRYNSWWFLRAPICSSRLPGLGVGADAHGQIRHRSLVCSCMDLLVLALSIAASGVRVLRTPTYCCRRSLPMASPCPRSSICSLQCLALCRSHLIGLDIARNLDGMEEHSRPGQEGV